MNAIFIFLLMPNALVLSQQHVITAFNRFAGPVNYRPIIGILSQKYHDTLSPSNNESYIAASYVKFVEAGGARALPIHIYRNDSYYEDILKSINGVLLPGGGASLTDSQYAVIGKKIYQHAMRSYDEGNFFPIWATCLGFELLATLMVPNAPILTNCSASNLVMPLNITKDTETSRLFNNIPSDVLQFVLNLPVTINFHRKCITPEDANSSGLATLIDILSTNQDANNVTFISTYEVKKYPFYAVQWHPEKNPYEWTTDSRWNNIPHTPEAVRVSQYFSNFLVSEARKSDQHFEKSGREQIELIYNISPFYSGKYGSEFSEIYKFRVG